MQKNTNAQKHTWYAVCAHSANQTVWSKMQTGATKSSEIGAKIGAKSQNIGAKSWSKKIRAAEQKVGAKRTGHRRKMLEQKIRTSEQIVGAKK